MSSPDPIEGRAEEVVAILKRELPGFAAELHASTDTFRVRGPVLFNATMGVEVTYLVGSMSPAAVAAPLIEKTRRHAIEAFGLRKVIDEELAHARRFARATGFNDGKRAGIAEGRRELLAELMAALNPDDFEGDEAELDG